MQRHLVSVAGVRVMAREPKENIDLAGPGDDPVVENSAAVVLAAVDRELDVPVVDLHGGHDREDSDHKKVGMSSRHPHVLTRSCGVRDGPISDSGKRCAATHSCGVQVPSCG